MCGICLCWTPDSFDLARGVCADLRLSLQHRGPDGQGQRDFPVHGLSLGHTRLSIVDLAGSPQPMTSQCGRYTLIFNGEIFNYRALRADVDYQFSTDGDTETLLALWVQHGIRALPMIRGQFAFAVWDEHLQELSLAIDASGVLPLYVGIAEGTVLAASSATAIARQRGYQPSRGYILDLLTKRAVAAPATPWREISRVAPGELWRIRSGDITRERWLPTFAARASQPKRTSAHRIAAVLRESAQRAITADVEVGIFLSGGLDSAIVAKLASDQLPYQMRAYTAAWSQQARESEAENASRTAKVLNLDHTLVEVEARDWWEALQSGSAFRDAPMAEPADAVIYLLAQRAAKDVKVVLTGEGADELFGGYPKYRAEALAAIPGTYALAHQVGKLGFAGGNQKARRLLEALGTKSAQLRFPRYFATPWPSDVRFEISADSATEASARGVRALRDYDLKHYLAPILLDRADRMAMANSLEVRPLFLDADVIDAALAIPTSQMISALGTKRLLRKAARLILPHELTHTRKRGFPLPLADWLRGDLQDVATLTLAQDSSMVDPLMSPAERLALLENHAAGRGNHALALFTLLSLLIWIDTAS